MLRRVEQWDSDLVHLNQMEHLPEKRRVHLETGLVQSISHHRKNVLDQRQQILLVKSLRNIWRSTDIGEQFVQNLQTLGMKIVRQNE